jgi:hypothetical protein
MLWQSAFYRCVNESRRYLLDDNQGGKLANGALHELIDKGYFVPHATAVRRLLDKGPKSGPRGVYSLYALLEDIGENIGLLTRGNVLEARGLPYDFEPLEVQARKAAISKAIESGQAGYFIEQDGWFEAKYWHETMDKLCGVNPEARSSSDKPDAGKINSLLHQLAERGRNVHDWVDKFIAHAATPESRQTLKVEHQTISIAALWAAERVIVRTANFISMFFVSGHNIGGVPIPQFDQFIHLDQPFIRGDALPAMSNAWEAHCRETNSCEKWFWDGPLSDASDIWAE